MSRIRAAATVVYVPIRDDADELIGIMLCIPTSTKRESGRAGRPFMPYCFRSNALIVAAIKEGRPQKLGGRGIAG
jgi:hypothetical protein